MNTKQVVSATVAIAAFSFAGFVCAQEATQEAWANSTKTRAEARAELAQAQKDGSLNVSSYTYVVEPVHSQKSRGQVRAELEQAMKSGSFNLTSYNYVEPAHAQKSRQQVRGELEQSMKDGSFKLTSYTYQ